MGASPSKSSQQTNRAEHRSRDDELDDVLYGGRCSIVNDSECGSFIFIDREWNGSISSAEDVLLTDDIDYNVTIEPQENRTEGFQVDIVQTGASNEDETTRSPPKEHTSPQQVDGGVIIRKESDPIQNGGVTIRKESDPVNDDGVIIRKESDSINNGGVIIRKESDPVNDGGVIIRKESDPINDGGVIIREESDPINITSNPCSTVEEFPDQWTPNTEILQRSSVDNFIPSDTNLAGREEWIQIGGCDSTLSNFYEIFSTYGSISALAQTKDHTYVKFSSWAGITNVFADIRNVKQFHKINSLKKVEDHELKKHPDRTEIYLDLPSFVVTYLKEHHELLKALNIVTMTATDNICLNAPKIHQVLDHLRKSVSKRFQHFRFFPFGCHILGSCDRYAPLEIFVDVGDMYAGCHKQSTAEQIAIAKEMRKLISDDIIWCSDEESPIGVFFHKTVGLTCIVNFNNGFGDRCTRLLGVFMEYDERFRILYLMLEIWSKQCSLQGFSNGLNSYIVALLLVFYLQVIPVPLLPPIQRIRSGRPVVIKGWDCTFIEDANLLPRNECSTELFSLLRGFFVFYGSYDWKRVVCPVLGQSVDREVFSSPSMPFPEDPTIANYFSALSEQVPNIPHLDTSTSMCVQDFFNLSENVAKGVSPEILLRFQSLCRQSHKMIYSAESKMSFGLHNPHHISSVPYHGFNMQRRDQLAHELSRGKCGSLSDCTTSSRSWERSSNSDNLNDNEHGMHCVCTKCSWTSENGRENWQQATRIERQRFRHSQDVRSQPKVIPNVRGRKVQQSSQPARSFRGRVFWHNGQKNPRVMD